MREQDTTRLKSESRVDDELLPMEQLFERLAKARQDIEAEEQVLQGNFDPQASLRLDRLRLATDRLANWILERMAA